MTLPDILPLLDKLAVMARLMERMDCKYADMERWFSCGLTGI